MAKLTTAEFIEAIKELSVLELNELVKACEEEFGVSAAHARNDVGFRHEPRLFLMRGLVLHGSFFTSARIL